jgi:deoxyribonuclease V
MTSPDADGPADADGPVPRPPFSRTEAIALQRALAEQVERETRLGPVGLIAGVDCAAPRFGTRIRAAIVLLRWPDLELVEQHRAEVATPLPYIPGLLSFRELPAILEAWRQLTVTPDLTMVDGQGIAHPRRLGIAAHLGVLLGLPTIGVAKSLLVGQPRGVHPGPDPGDRLDLYDRDERIATLVRTRRGARPLVVSTGHRVSLDDATAWVERCVRGFRLPEPTRRAHMLASMPERAISPEG